jgi:hypothetical protein
MKRLIALMCVIGGIMSVMPEEGSARQPLLHQPADYFVTGTGAEIRFSLTGFSPTAAQSGYVLIRETGRQTYRRLPAEIRNNEFVAIVPADFITPPSVEYYLVVENVAGASITWPENNPEEFPVTVQVIDRAEEQEFRRSGITEGIEYTILTPAPGERVPFFDAVVAIAIFTEQEIDPAQLGLIWNRRDVTAEAEITNRFVSYIPSSVSTGRQYVELFVRDGERRIVIVSWEFTAYDPDAVTPVLSGARLLPEGSVELGYRHQSFGGFTRNILTGETRMSGNAGDFGYNLTALVSSEETPRLQAQNRFSADLRYRNIAQLQLGDMYPDLNPFMISGRRVFGVEAGVRTLRQNLNFYFLLGRLNRTVDVRYGEIEKQIVQITENIQDSVYVLGLREAGATYRRDIMAARVEFGSSRPFQLGLNMMRVQDATSSLSLYRGLDELPASFTGTPAGQEALANPDLFRIENPGIRPQGNFVLATDIRVNADRNRIQFQSDAAVSLLNNDITGGNLTAERAEELGYIVDSGTIDWINRFSWFIIINENLNATPFRLEDEQTDVFVPSGIFANQNRLMFNYFNHTLSVQYRWVGPDYASLASTGLRRDQSGYLISDRVRLLGNTLFLTGSYERYRDNVIKNRSSTTWTNGYRFNTSWFPTDRRYPNISFGVNYQQRDNGIERSNPLFDNQPENIRNAAVRNIVVVDGDTLVTATPRNNSTLQITGTVSKQFEWLDAANEASFSISNILTRDNLFAFGDFKGLNLSLGLRSLLRTMPMRLGLTASFNRSEALGGLNSTDISGITASVGYEFLEQRLNVYSELGYAYRSSELQSLATTGLSGTLSPFNNFYVPDAESLVRIRSNSYIVRAGSRFSIDWNHSIALDMSYNNVVSKDRFGSIPDDRFIQLRYIFNF